MQVLMISRCPPYPLHLGDRLIVYHLAQEMAARGVEIDLLAVAESASDWSLSEQQHYTPYFRDVMLFDEKRRPLPELLRRSMFPSVRFPQRAEDAFAPEMWREIERRLRMRSYDVIHLFGGIQVYEFYHALKGNAAMITPYESYSLYMRRQVEQNKGTLLQKLTHRFNLMAAQNFERWMFSPYAITTVLSDVDRDALHTLNSDLRIEVIPNGVDLDQFQLMRQKREPERLLFLGNFEYAPNVDAALWLANDILPRIRQQIPDVKLWLVGNAPPPEIQALHSDGITVTGWVEDVRPYFASATAFVCPLRIGAGIKNKVLEALASGCPVVSTRLSVDGILVENNESVLLGNTTGEIVTQVIRLLQKPELQTHLQTNGRNVIEKHYSWKGVANQYYDFYTELQG